MARSNTENGGDRQRSKTAKRKLLFIMFVVFVSNMLLRSFTRKVRVVTDDVRGRSPHAFFSVALPKMVSIAFWLVHMGTASGIGLGAVMVWKRPSLAGYPGRLLWYWFAMNFVVIVITLALIEYARFMS